MEDVLVVVDMQNDFIDQALGSNEAIDIVDYVAAKIYLNLLFYKLFHNRQLLMYLRY